MAEEKSPIIEVHDLDTLDDLEEEKEQSEAEEEITAQDINEIVANIPVEIEVVDTSGSSHILKIYSSTINKMVLVDKAIEELEEAGTEDVEMGPDEDITKYVERIHKRYMNIFNKMVEVLLLIINEHPDKPDYDREWIKENINIVDEDGNGHQIMDAYNYKSSAEKVLSLVKKMLASKKFA